MWHTLHLKYSLRVQRDNVMALMRELDPQGIQLWAKRNFVKKRVSSSNVPNHVWHVDGYDKLKPYSFALNSCIDGYSGKVLWLRCGASNNDPGVIAQYYLNCLSECGIIPMRLRTDCGTENGTMAAIHCAWRSSHTDECAGATSHLYGSSMANQRIESCWSYFHKQRYYYDMHFYIGSLHPRNILKWTLKHNKV